MKIQTTSRKSAFTLVEVTLAIGIAAVSMLGVVALLPIGIASNRDSVNTTHAASLVEAVIMDLKGVADGGTSLVYGLSMTAEEAPAVVYFKADGSKSTDVTAADYRASVTVTPPAARFSPALVRVVVSWPATERPANSYEALTAFVPNLPLTLP